MRLAPLFPQENTRCPYRCVQDKIDCCARDQSTGATEERHQRGAGQGLGNKKIDGDTCGLTGNGNHGAKKGPDGKGDQIGFCLYRQNRRAALSGGGAFCRAASG